MTFELLVKRLNPKLKAIAFRANRSRTFFNEEDLYQEELLHLWKEFKAGTLADKTDSYILQGCYFYLQNYLRTTKDKVKPLSLEAHDAADGEREHEAIAVRDERAGHFVDRLDDEQLADTIRNNGLTPREKNICTYFSEGLTTRQIGELCGVSHVRVIKMRDEIRRKCLKHVDRI
jgi:RNA polymerase sigma factor (sigma-70 family)